MYIHKQIKLNRVACFQYNFVNLYKAADFTNNIIVSNNEDEGA